MRRDWDLRARENALYYIDCGHADSEEAFWRSGEEDLVNFILRDLDLDRNASALEIGCGIGRLLRPLSFRVASAVGVDISGEMIERARQALADRPNLLLLHTSGDLADVADASSDFLFSFIVFQHIPVKRAVSRYFEEAARVLKAGAVLRIQVDGRPSRRRSADTWDGVRYTPEEVALELKSAGLELLDLTGAGTQYMWITAQQHAEPGRPVSAAVRFHRKEWNPEAVNRLLRRMGYDPASEGPRILSGQANLRQLAQRVIEINENEKPRTYVSRAYRIFLDREPDDEGLASYIAEIERGISRTNLVDCLLNSAEFAAKHRV